MLPSAEVSFDGIEETCRVERAVIRHGRDDPTSQPTADSATFDILGQLPAGVDIGTPVSLDAILGGVRYPRFRGKVTDIEVGWQDVDLPVARLIAVSELADLGRRVIGAESWPTETDGARVNRAIGLAGVATDPVRSDPGTVQVLARDVDTQPALAIAADAASDGNGLIWQAKDGAVLYADAYHRKGATAALALDACDIPLDVTWIRNLEGLVNDVRIGYGTNPDAPPATQADLAAHADTPHGGAEAHPDLATHDALGLATDADLTAHGAAADAHPGYATDADLTTHAGTPHGAAHPDLATHDALGLATDAALTAHEAAANPHATYATDADLTAHGAAADPHAGYLTEAAHTEAAHTAMAGLATQSELDAHAATSHGGPHPGLAPHDTLGLATDAELAAHAAGSDPHTGYVLESLHLADISGGADPHPGYGTEAELAAHAAAANPHPAYATDLDLSGHAAAFNPHPVYATDDDLTAHAGTPHGGGAGGLVLIPESATELLNASRSTTLAETQIASGAGTGAVAVLLNLWANNSVTPNAGNVLDVLHGGSQSGAAASVRGGSTAGYTSHTQCIVYLSNSNFRYRVTVAGGTIAYRIYRVGYFVEA